MRALAGVGAAKAKCKSLLLQQQSLVDSALAPFVDGRQDMGHRDRRRASQLLGDLVDLVVEPGRLDDTCQQAELVRPQGLHRLAEQAELQRCRASAEAGQPLRAPEAGNQPKVDLRLAQARVRAGDAQVACQCQLKSSAQRMPLDSGNDRLAHRFDGAHQGLTMARELLCLDNAIATHLGDIRARGEGFFSRAFQDQHADGVVSSRLLDGNGQLREKVPVQRIELAGTIDGHAADAGVIPGQQDGIGHREFSSVRWHCTRGSSFGGALPEKGLLNVGEPLGQPETLRTVGFTTDTIPLERENRMRKFATTPLLSLVAILPFAVAAQTAPASPSPAAPAPSASIPVNRDQLSYAIGFEVGSNLSGHKVDINTKRLIQGFEDAYAKETPAVPIADMRQQLAGLQQRLRAQAIAAYRKVAAANLQASEAFLAQNKTKPGVVTLPDGIQYRVLENGKGSRHPTATSTVTVNFRASLPDGRGFASSYANGKPISFVVDKMILAWQKILPLMVAGDRWQVFVPPQFAFGAAGQPPQVGPNQAVVFDLKLIKIGGSGK